MNNLLNIVYPYMEEKSKVGFKAASNAEWFHPRLNLRLNPKPNLLPNKKSYPLSNERWSPRLNLRSNPNFFPN